jgi:hypothetical protein
MDSSSRSPNRVLSKTKYLCGLQCPKLLWTHYHDQGAFGAPDPDVQFRFDQGHLVGELAQSLYPGGITIGWDIGIDNVLVQSKETLAKRVPIFEAGFIHGRAFARADILVPAGKTKWDIVEVKSTAGVKDHHIDDVAFQRYVYEGAGVPIRRCYVMYIDTGYVRHGDADPEELFVMDDVTAEVKEVLTKVGRRVRKMLTVIGKTSCPGAKVGDRCYDPYTCDLEDSCWSFLPQRNVFTLTHGWRKARRLMKQGVLAIKDIPAGFPLSQRQQIQAKSTRRSRAHVDRKALREFLEQLEYPLYFLDFETIGTPIPLFDGTRPYQQVPFQYSVHVQPSPGARAKHYSFLPKTSKDPRAKLLELLRGRLGDRGSIISYNANFEKLRLQECADRLPEFADWVDGVLPRLVDLWRPFHKMDYYHPRQDGSTSLKAVMPALTGRGYDDLDVTDGGTAGRAFLDLIFGGLPRKERDEIRQKLKLYCGRDTEGMVWIVDRLRDLVE